MSIKRHSAKGTSEMNTSYNINNEKTEEKRIRRFPSVEIHKGFINFICSLIRIITCETAVKIEKVSLAIAGFIGFFGVMGGVESGTIGLGAGMFLFAVITFSEIIVLRSISKYDDSRRKG